MPVASIPFTLAWKDGSIAFTATTATTKLTFASGDGSGSTFGVALDDVTAIPDLGAPPPVSQTVDTPYLYQAAPVGSTTQILGVLGTGSAGTFHVQFLTSATCGDDGHLASPTTVLSGGSPLIVNVPVDSTGHANISATIPLAASGPTTYVAAQVVDPPGHSNVGPCILVTDPNDRWTTAKVLAANGSVKGYLDDYGRSRWYKFPIQPGGRVKVTISGAGGGAQPGDFD